jgi:hypothetical protein
VLIVVMLSIVVKSAIVPIVIMLSVDELNVFVLGPLCCVSLC